MNKEGFERKVILLFEQKIKVNGMFWLPIVTVGLIYLLSRLGVSNR